MANTPTIHPNPAVETIHQLTLLVAFATAGLVIAAAGLHFLLGMEFGISYGQARMIIPALLIGLAFSTVSLHVFQFGAEASDAFVQAFLPRDRFELAQLAGLSTSLVLVWFINAWLLLALVILFVLRQVYILFIAAIFPLLAVAWPLPNTRRYADTFISAWFAALAIAPLDVLVLRFNLELLKGSGAFGLQPVSNWVLGIASFSLMLWIPYQLYGASQAMIGSSRRITGDVEQSVRGWRSGGSNELESDDWDRERNDRWRDRNRRRRR